MFVGRDEVSRIVSFARDVCHGRGQSIRIQLSTSEFPERRRDAILNNVSDAYVIEIVIVLDVCIAKCMLCVYTLFY